MQLTSQIRSFIAENFVFGPSDQIGDDESFLESGILDSTGVLQLVDFLEQTYGVRVEDDELTPDNLDSIVQIESYLNRKLRGARGATAPELLEAEAGGYA